MPKGWVNYLPKWVGHSLRNNQPAVSTLEKLAKVFEVSITEFFRSDDVNEPVNIPLLEKIKLIDSLGDEEKQALFKMIDLAISNKRMKDNLQSLIAS